MFARSKTSKLTMRTMIAAALLAVTACGSDESGAGTDSSTATTATTTTAAPVATVAATTTSTSVATVETSTESTAAQPAETVATTAKTTPTTQAPTTQVPTTQARPTSTTTDTGAEYVEVPGPSVPAQTAPVGTGSDHPDGVYYASVSEGGDPAGADGAVTFELVQLFTGQACIDHFGADEDACVGDYGVETDPTSFVDVDVDNVFVSVVDAATKQSYKVSGAELRELLLGGEPTAGAPADYLYSGFGYIVTYQGGSISRVEQWWTP